MRPRILPLGPALAALLLLAPAFAAADAGDSAGARPTPALGIGDEHGREERADHLHSPSERAGVDVMPSYQDLAVRGLVGDLQVELRARLAVAENVTLLLTASPHVLVTGGTSASFARIEEGAPALATFRLHALEPGVHELRLEAFGAPGVRTLRMGWLHAQELGPAWLELDHVASEPVFGDGVPLDAPGAGADASDEPALEPAASGRPWPATPRDDVESARVGVLPASAAAGLDGGAGAAGQDGTASAIEARICWSFNDALPSDPWWSRLRWADLVVKASVVGPDPILAHGRTDAKGCARIPISSSSAVGADGAPAAIYVVMRSCNVEVCVVGKDAPNGYAWSTWPMAATSSGVVDFGEWGAGTRQYAARSFAYHNNGWSWFVNMGQHPDALIPPVDVRIPAQEFGESKTFARPSESRIYVAVNGADEHSDDTAIHEYAHHVHWHATKDRWTSPGGSHWLCESSQNAALAWTEGFAQFAAVKANHDLGSKGVPGARSDRLKNRDPMLDIEKQGCRYGYAAGENEWRVAQSLWDLVDTGHDGIDDGWWSLVDVLWMVRTCKAMSFQDFYHDGNPVGNDCNWKELGRPVCVFQRATYPNGYDLFDAWPQILHFSGPKEPAWARGVVTLSTIVGSDETGHCPYQTTYRMTKAQRCDPDGAILVGNATGAYPLRAWDTRGVPDGASYYLCAYVDNGIHWRLVESEAKYTVDNTAPVVSFQGSANANGWYGDPWWIPFGCVDAVSGATSRDDWDLRVDLGPWTSLDPWDTSLRIEMEGIHIYSVRCADRAGNVGSGSETVRLDTRAPSVTVEYLPARFDKDRVDVRLTCSDPAPGSGCTPMWSLTNFHYDPYTAPIVLTEMRRFHAYAVDLAGNEGPLKYEQAGIDPTPPSVWVNVTSMMDPSPLGEWHATPPRISIACSDALAGVDRISYRVDGGQVIPYFAPFELPGDGVRNVTATCTDKARHATNASAVVKIDAVPPVATFTLTGPLGGRDGWHRGPVTLDIECSNVGLDVRRRGYRVDGGAYTLRTWGEHPGNFTVDVAPGWHTLEVSCQLFTWSRGTAEGAFGIDVVAPRVTLPTDGGWSSGGRTIFVPCADDLSGCASIVSRIDGGDWRARGASIWIEGGGEHLVEVYGVDRAGNAGPIASARYGVDDMPPNVSVSIGDSTGYVTISWTATDAGSGLAGEALVEREDASAPGGWTTLCATDVSGGSASGQCLVAPAPACYRVVVRDNAGRTGTASRCYDPT